MDRAKTKVGQLENLLLLTFFFQLKFFLSSSLDL